MKQGTSSGFSLIELMVVIAIIGALAAVIIPSYKMYIIRANVASVLPLLDGLVEKSIAFSAATGRYGNLNDLGLIIDGYGCGGPGAGYNCSTYAESAAILGKYNPSPSSYSPYNLVQMGDQTSDITAVGRNYFFAPPVGSQLFCGAAGLVSMRLDPIAIGYPADTESTAIISLVCNFYNVNGVINKLCWYRYTDPSDPTGATWGTDSLISGYYNECANSMCTIVNTDFDNLYSYYYYSNATCM
jgi:prepilin-type N-terminal cleavage/methylation domain-containing protein